MRGAVSVGIELEDAIKLIPLSDGGSRHRGKENG